VTTSTRDLVSVLCRRGAWGEGVAAPTAASFTRRLADGSEVTAEDLFAVRPGVVRQIARRCADEADQKVKTPPFAIDDLRAFGLMQRGVRFRLPYEWAHHPTIVAVDCDIPYATLGINQASLAKPQP
jgi:hypothetical protein